MIGMLDSDSWQFLNHLHSSHSSSSLSSTSQITVTRHFQSPRASCVPCAFHVYASFGALLTDWAPDIRTRANVQPCVKHSMIIFVHS